MLFICLCSIELRLSKWIPGIDHNHLTAELLVTNCGARWGPHGIVAVSIQHIDRVEAIHRCTKQAAEPDGVERVDARVSG